MHVHVDRGVRAVGWRELLAFVPFARSTHHPCCAQNVSLYSICQMRLKYVIIYE